MTDPTNTQNALPANWFMLPTPQLQAYLDRLDDSTAEWEAVVDELDKREAEHELKVNNGGVLP